MAGSIQLLNGDPTDLPTPASGRTSLGADTSSNLFTKDAAGNIVYPDSQSFHGQSAAGGFTVTPASSDHLEAVTSTAVPGTVVATLSPGSTGNRLRVTLSLPSVAGVIYEFFSDSADQYSYTTTGTEPKHTLTVDFFFNGTNWQYELALAS